MSLSRRWKVSEALAKVLSWLFFPFVSFLFFRVYNSHGWVCIWDMLIKDASDASNNRKRNASMSFFYMYLCFEHILSCFNIDVLMTLYSIDATVLKVPAVLSFWSTLSSDSRFEIGHNKSSSKTRNISTAIVEVLPFPAISQFFFQFNAAVLLLHHQECYGIS